MRRRSSSPRAAGRHWWMALCSLSTGRTSTPWRARRVHDRDRRPSPALPCWRARCACQPRSPRAPPRAPRCPMTRTARCRRRRGRPAHTARRGRWPASRRARRSTPRPRARTSASAASVAIATARGRKRRPARPSPRRSRRRRARRPSSTIGMRVDHLERAAPDRAGRAENRQAFHAARSASRRGRRGTDSRPGTRTAARRCDRACRRGRGSAPDESLTPTLRLSSDSNRSPTMPAATRIRPSAASSDQRDRGKHQRAQQRRDDATGEAPQTRALDRLLRADRRRERRAPERTAAEGLRRVADDDGEERQQQRPPAPSARGSPRRGRAAAPR